MNGNDRAGVSAGRRPFQPGWDAVLLVFRAGPDLYAVDANSVLEVIPVIPATRIPSAPDFLEGVIELEGLVVPVVDLKAHLGHGPCKAAKRSRYILSQVYGKVLALLVDEVIEVTRVGKDDLSTAPEVLKDAGVKHVCGVLRRNGLTLILDLEGAFSKQELEALQDLEQVSRNRERDT